MTFKNAIGKAAGSNAHAIETTIRREATMQTTTLMEMLTAKLCGSSITPVGRAALSMSFAMAIHFAGYEFARNTSLSLFTSNKVGFGSSSSALSLAMACVTPFSLLLLMWYGQELENSGPRVALRHTNIACMLAIIAAGSTIYIMEQTNIGMGTTAIFKKTRIGNIKLDVTPVKVLVWIMYLLQNSYAHLIYQQHWSFIGSVLTPSQGAKWFASITGLTSITSTISAGLVSTMTTKVPLPLLFGFGTGIALAISTGFADQAYSIAEHHHFAPHKDSGDKAQASNSSKGNNSQQLKPEKQHVSTVTKASRLFKRVPTLKLLFFEVMSFTGLATLLNLCLVKKLKLTFIDDSERAKWTSHFWAWANGLSGILQFFVLPTLFRIVEPKDFFPVLPFMIFILSLYQSLQLDPDLRLIGGSFLLIKVMDYALRNVISELVYAALDFESRYLGKEVIGVFGNRLGKSGMSLALSLITATYGELGLQAMSLLSTFASFAWLTTGIKLSKSIPSARITSKKKRCDKTD